MSHRIILFRGMNTGGVRAPVGEQRAMAEAMGLKNPRTLQASGNLMVEAVGDDLFFWFPNGQGQSVIFKKATPRMLGMGTGRNWSTVLKLAAIVSGKSDSM